MSRDFEVTPFQMSDREKKANRGKVGRALSSMGGASGGQTPEDKAADAEAKRAEIIDRQIRGMERRVRLAAVDAETQIELSQMFAEEDIRRRLALKEINEAEAERMRLVAVQTALMATQEIRRDEARAAVEEEERLRQTMHQAELERADELMQKRRQAAQEHIEITRSSISAVSNLMRAGAAVAGLIEDTAARDSRERALEAFRVKQAFLVAMATIDTAAAIMSAVESAPNYIVGVIQAASAAALGAVQIATIAATQPSFGDAGLLPLTGLRDTHRSAIIRNDEMVIDPKGTRDISAMFEMMRRNMELAPQGNEGAVRVVNVIDGEVVTDVVQRRLSARIERGDDFRQRVRV